jgi:hypothetical protein
LFNYNIFKINKNKSLLANKYTLNTILQILKNNKKKFSIKKEKLQILIDKIDECIKKHYNKSLQKHSKIIKIL